MAQPCGLAAAQVLHKWGGHLCNMSGLTGPRRPPWRSLCGIAETERDYRTESICFSMLESQQPVYRRAWDLIERKFKGCVLFCMRHARMGKSNGRVLDNAEHLPTASPTRLPTLRALGAKSLVRIAS